ncbi:transposase [Streptomyces sp. NPDC002619]|uniref:transposase n=1 Tax=Streptomyces sp. NPDC002619 TaxID=3364655 RepID=UPI00368DCFA3
MGSKFTNRYSDEYKRDAIELVRSSGRTVTEVARELGISSESLRGWVKKARATQEAEAGAGLSGPGLHGRWSGRGWRVVSDPTRTCPDLGIGNLECPLPNRAVRRRSGRSPQ